MNKLGLRCYGAFAPFVIAVLLAALSSGCVEIHGGAVEISWAIFAPGGRATNDCSCTNPEIANVRLELISTADGSNPCAALDSCEFQCGRKSGSTPFVVPPGRYSFSLLAFGIDGTRLGDTLGFRFTPPVTRPVEWGKPTELDAFTIEAPCSDACNGQTMNQPCAR